MRPATHSLRSVRVVAACSGLGSGAPEWKIFRCVVKSDFRLCLGAPKTPAPRAPHVGRGRAAHPPSVMGLGPPPAAEGIIPPDPLIILQRPQNDRLPPSICLSSEARKAGGVWGSRYSPRDLLRAPSAEPATAGRRLKTLTFVLP